MLLLIACTFFLMLIILIATANIFVMGGFIDLETNNTRQNVESVMDTIADTLSRLHTTTGDWSFWDETYKFLNDLNEDYIRENLEVNTFTTLKINLMIFIDLKGNCVYERFVDLDTEKTTAMPDGLMPKILRIAASLKSSDPNGRSGIVMTGTMPILLAARPVLKNDMSGPSRGTLIIGRYLDEVEIERISHMIHLSIGIHPIDGQPLPADYRSAETLFSGETPIVVQPEDRKTIAGFVVQPDIDGQPAFIMKVRIPRSIYNHGRATMFYYVIFLSITAIIVMLLVIFFMERVVLGPLQRISNRVVQADKSGILRQDFGTNKRDELGNLDAVIDNFIRQIREKTSELEEMNRLLQEDIMRRKQSESALQHRVAAETFIADVSIRCIDLPSSKTDSVINEALHGIMSITGVDRSYVFLLDEKHKTMDNTYECCAPGIIPQKENLQGLAWDAFPWWLSRLRRFETIEIPRVSDLPPEAASEKKIIEGLDSRSVIAVPVIWQREIRGFLGFDSIRSERTWTDEDRQILRTLANLFSIIFERKRTEEQGRSMQEQLYQAQKLESIGRLAGGVAHDFNNLLLIILGYLEMLLQDLPMDHPHHEPLQEMHKAAIKARDLTRQLLAFSRKQILEMKTVDINDLVRRFEKLLRRVIGEDIELRLSLANKVLPVKADAVQLEQVLMNMAVNARDAMPDGGNLTIETADVFLDDNYAAEKSGITPGAFVMIAVSDTGAGMDHETLNRVFEPFFTTKDIEKGSGLGLATSYGIVKQHNGNIWIYSEPGQGTTFKIYLPLCMEEEETKEDILPSTPLPIGTATILIIEDDPTVRKITSRILSNYGYNVIESENVSDAVERASGYDEPIRLVLSDVIMPEMKGPEVYAKIRKYHPEAEVLYMSGYTDDMIVSHGILEEGIYFIQKPFTVNGLLEKVSHVINARKEDVK